MVINTNDQQFDVATTATLISEAKQGTAKRKLVIITNIGSDNITLGFGIEPADTKGIYLASKATYVASADNNYTVPQGRIFAISDGASGAVSIHEEVEE